MKKQITILYQQCDVGLCMYLYYYIYMETLPSDHGDIKQQSW